MTRARAKLCIPWILAWHLACAAPLAVGAGLATAAEERARITSERAAAQAAFAARERECQTRFVVTACVDAARKDQREVLTLLRQQERALDETQRRERATQRLESAHGQPDAAVAATSEAPASVPRAAGRHADAHGREHAHATRTSDASQEQRRVSEARSTAKFEAASEAARARREAVERRNAERAAGKGKNAQPLPVPAGASAP